MNKLNGIIEELVDLANESGSISIEDVKILISRAFIEGINFSEKNSSNTIDININASIEEVEIMSKGNPVFTGNYHDLPSDPIELYNLLKSLGINTRLNNIA